jgi:iron-sulfur cluster assembly accessory protein
MLKRLFSTLRQPISVTLPAWNKMNQISNTQKIDRFLFSATQGGCNGFNYNLNLLNDYDYKTICSEQSIIPTVIKTNNTELVIDPVSEFLLLGTTIDYIQEDYSKGIFESKFIFISNKTFASSCGCGISFTPKN